jgi:hypothetical protein
MAAVLGILLRGAISVKKMLNSFLVTSVLFIFER